jgi:septum formation topological specificity factor MinE
MATLKEKLQIVLQKTRNDDRLIEALRAELGSATRGMSRSPG